MALNSLNCLNLPSWYLIVVIQYNTLPIHNHYPSVIPFWNRGIDGELIGEEKKIKKIIIYNEAVSRGVSLHAEPTALATLARLPRAEAV